MFFRYQFVNTWWKQYEEYFLDARLKFLVFACFIQEQKSVCNCKYFLMILKDHLKIHCFISRKFLTKIIKIGHFDHFGVVNIRFSTTFLGTFVNSSTTEIRISAVSRNVTKLKGTPIWLSNCFSSLALDSISRAAG